MKKQCLTPLSKDISVAQRFAAGNSVKNQDKKSYIYEIDKNGLGFVDVNKAFSSNPYRSEQEVSVKTKIPISNITRYSVYNSKTKTSTPWLPFNQNKK